MTKQQRLRQQLLHSRWNTDASGKIVERFDAVFDAEEINAAIATLGL
jgi:hypothetical protein